MFYSTVLQENENANEGYAADEKGRRKGGEMHIMVTSSGEQRGAPCETTTRSFANAQGPVGCSTR